METACFPGWESLAYTGLSTNTRGLAVQTDRADMRHIEQRQCFFNLNSKVTSLSSTTPEPSHSQHLNTPSFTEILQRNSQAEGI